MKAWMVILGLLAILAVVVVWFAGNAFSSLKGESDRVVAAADTFSRGLVTSGWTIDAFSGLATKDYLETISKDGDAAFAKYATLGKPQASEPCTLFKLNIINGVGTANAHCPMTFANGKATLLVDLFGANGAGWQVNGLAIQL